MVFYDLYYDGTYKITKEGNGINETIITIYDNDGDFVASFDTIVNSNHVVVVAGIYRFNIEMANQQVAIVEN